MQSSIRSLVIAVSTVAAVAVVPLAVGPAAFDHRDAVRADIAASAARDVPVDAFASGQEPRAGAAPADRAPVGQPSVSPNPVNPFPVNPSLVNPVPVSPSAVEPGPEGQGPIHAGIRAAASGTAVQGILGAGRPVVELSLGPPALDVAPAAAALVTVPPALGPVLPRTVPVADQVIEVLVETPSTAGAGGGVDVGEGADGVGSGMGGDLPPGSLPTPPYPQCPITGAGAWWTDPADPYTCLPPEPVSFHEPTPPGIAPELLEPIVEDPAPIGDAPR